MSVPTMFGMLGQIFGAGDRNRAAGVPMIRLMGPSFAIVSFAIGLGCAFTGSGYNLPFLVSSLAGRWGAQVPFLALAAFVFPKLGLDLGILGIWASFLVSDSVEAAVLVWTSCPHVPGTLKGPRAAGGLQQAYLDEHFPHAFHLGVIQG